jgi:serpin B
MERLLSAVFAITLLFANCKTDKDIPNTANDSMQLSKSEQAVGNATTEFGFKLMEQMHAEEPDKNQVISPVSVSIALGMLYNGTRDNTRDELRAGLGLDHMSEDQINSYYDKIITHLPVLDEAVKLSIANGIFHHDEFSPKKDYLNTVQDKFHSSITPLDFRDPQTPEVINQWVRDQTNDKIDKMLDHISRESVMFLMNALYFKGNWMEPFEKDQTREGTFTKADGSTYPVPFMNKQDNWNVWQGEQITAVDLPYGDSVFSMTLLLPTDDQLVAGVIQDLNMEMLQTIEDNLQPNRSIVEVPRFKLEYEAKLKPALHAMGMQQMFDAYEANLHGISEAQLFVRDVIHKTFIEVNEEGTEAAAATGVDIGITSMPPTISFNEPFVFLIRENINNTVVFAGKVMEP